MAQYRKKPIVIEATQWFKHGDHPAVRKPFHYVGNNDYGLIDTLEGNNHKVNPSDWIITGIEGERYPCRADIFEKTYEPVQ